MCLQPSNQLNQRSLVKFSGGGEGRFWWFKRAVLSPMSIVLTSVTSVLTHTVMAIGLDLPEVRMGEVGWGNIMMTSSGLFSHT